MSSTSYSPRAGSVADRVIHHLRTLAPRAELTSAALAEALGIEHNAIGPSMAPAVAAGAAFVRRKGGHPRAPQFWSLHEHARADGAAAPTPSPRAPAKRPALDEHADMPVRQIVRPANGAPPLPIVPPLFAPLAKAAGHAVQEAWMAGQQVSSLDLIEPPAPTTAAPSSAAPPPSPRAPAKRPALDEHADMPVRQIVRTANGAPPLPIVPPLFAPLAKAAGHAVQEAWMAGQQVSSLDLIEPPAPTTAAPSSAAPTPAAGHQEDLRFALWSDGHLELRRGAGLMVLLLPDETRALVSYLERLAETAS